MKLIEKEKAIQLRQEGKSVKKIGRILGVSSSTVSLWVRHIVLSEKQKEDLYLRSHQHVYAGNSKRYFDIRMSFQQEGRKIVQSSDSVFAMGCMLFWAEGSKNRNVLEFCNTDPEMMKFFISFLRQYFKVKNEDINLRVLCHTDNGISIEEIQKYWLSILCLDSSCLGQTVVRLGCGCKKKKRPYGVCYIRIFDVSLVQKIWGAIQGIIGFTREEIGS